MKNLLFWAREGLENFSNVFTLFLHGAVRVEYPKAINLFLLPSFTDAPSNINLVQCTVLENNARFPRQPATSSASQHQLFNQVNDQSQIKHWTPLISTHKTWCIEGECKSSSLFFCISISYHKLTHMTLFAVSKSKPLYTLSC